MASPWENTHGLKLFAYLPALIPGPVPPGYAGPYEDPEDFLHRFRAHAADALDPELLQDRQTLWDMETKGLEDCPSWMTLKPDPELKIWASVLMEDLECDFRSVQTFVTLVRKGSLGYHEGCRVLAHLFKDKDFDPSRPLSSDPSKWLKRASDEAIDALDNKAVWEAGPEGASSPYKGADPGAGKGQWSSSWGSYQPVSTGSSSSSWGSYQPQKGSSSASSSTDKGKGKGMGYRQGYR